MLAVVATAHRFQDKVSYLAKFAGCCSAGCWFYERLVVGVGVAGGGRIVGALEVAATCCSHTSNSTAVNASGEAIRGC